jgi:PKD repeat protein
MKNKIVKNWLRGIFIAFAIALSFSVVSTYAATPTGPGISPIPGESSSAAPILGGDGGSLEEGGQGLNIPTEGAQISPDIVQDRTFGALVTDIINYFIGFLGTIAVIIFIYAGVLMVVGGGDQANIDKGKKMMTYAAVGLVVVIISYSAVRFITGAAKNVQPDQCTSDADCPPNFTCNDAGVCVVPASCETTEDCPTDYECINNLCMQKAQCLTSANCAPGQYCSSAGFCVQGSDTVCTTNEDCNDPDLVCDAFGFCRNPLANEDSPCTDNTNCPPRFVCNVEQGHCEAGGSGLGGGGATSGPSVAASDEVLSQMDQLVDDTLALLDGIGDAINSLPEGVKDNVNNILGQGTLADKMAGIDALIAQTTDPKVLEVLERLAEALEKLNDLREDLDDLRLVMPESEDTIKSWDETSAALDSLIDDPANNIKLRRFEKNYRELQDLIRKFPIVKSVIRAVPAEGNVPFTVTFDGMDSVDPTGGTISDYKWSYTDSSGSLVSLGNSPVVVYEFTEPNTYSVRLQVSTSQKDNKGYQTATDGVSYVRVRANPPASKVGFKINGVEAKDVYHVTLKEARAGLAFDPSVTVPALGRTIEKYEWFYGDSATEERTAPTTVAHSYEKPGEYFVTLKVTDSHAVSDKRIIKLFVKSLAADIQISPTEGNVNTEFNFQGVNSRSDDGAIRDFEWLIEDSEGNTITESTEESFYYRFDRPGEYKVTLLVTDTTGAKDRNMKILKIASRPPIASFTYETPKQNHPNLVEFDALNSYDPDQGDNITYSWDFDGDGTFDVVNTKDIKTTHEYDRIGAYKVTLQVEDSFGQRSQTERGITISSVLSGDIVISKRAAQVGEEMTFKSESPNAVAYLWEFGDGETASTEDKEVKHTYNKKGKYRVKMNFFDEEDNDNYDVSYMLIGDSDTPVALASVSVDGRDSGVMENLCGEGKNGTIVTRANTLLLSAKDSINTDGSGRLLTYDWRMPDGTRNSKKEFMYKFNEINIEGECFSVNLVVRDQVSGKISQEDIMYFKVINQLPTISDLVIDAESGKGLVTPVKVTLRAINPKDADGRIKVYRWWYMREGFDDERLGLHTTNKPETEIVITAQGEPDVLNKYIFVLEITDSDNGVYDSFERFGSLSAVEVKNGPNLSPVAEFTMDKSTISVGDSITFVSQSYDPQGDILPNDAYKWDFDGDGQFDDVSTGPQLSRQFNTPGEYNVRLKVIYRGLSSSAAKTIVVQQVQSLPQAAFTYTVDNKTVNFDASNSRFDPNLEDTTLRYEWDFDIAKDANGNGVNDDDIESTELKPTFIYDEVALYKVRLKVKDSLGMEGVVVRDVDLRKSQAEREEGTYRSVKIISPDQPLTSLDVSVSPMEVTKGGTADISVMVTNADGSPYYGQVFFEIAEGSGDISPNPVDAKDSKASAIFTATDTGIVRINVRASEAYFGEVLEQIVINVK